jgi:hypothetical protein
MAGDGGHVALGVAGRRAVKGKPSAGVLDLHASNVLWIVWGWHDRAYALVVLQVGLALLNIRGVSKNDPA